MSTSYRTLIFANQADPGHSDDFKDAIERTLNKDEYVIFHELPKKPESLFDATIDEMLLSKVVLLDGIPIHQKMNPDFLIHYGICYPLNKKCFFLVVDKNSAETNTDVKPRVVEGVIHFEYYLDLTKELKMIIKKSITDNKTMYKDERTKKPVHSFKVFGVDPNQNIDLYGELSNFTAGTDWKPKFHFDLGTFSTLRDLARSIGARSFNIFCLDAKNAESMYIGIGIAIGMGRPFLIIKPKAIELPQSLMGYNGILAYDSFTQLHEQLKHYAQDFLSDKVLEWNGSTYNSILSRLELQINKYDANELERAENIINAVNSALGSASAKSYALLGDIYREKNRKISPDDVTLLLKAKEFYEQALRILKDYKRCSDALTVIDKHIQLIDLLTNHQYSSFPRLLALIGNDLTSENYLYVREYLIGEVKKLIQANEYANALALLVAMQVHDQSEEIKSLISLILEKAPEVSIEALQRWQIYIAEQESEILHLTEEIEKQESSSEELSAELNKMQFNSTKYREKVLEIEKERDELKNKLESIYAQFLSVQQANEKLEKLVTDDSLRNKIEVARKLRGRGVIVNFGQLGWGIYKGLDGTPYLIRDGKTFPVHEGLVLIDRDIVRDETGKGNTQFIPRTSISIDSDNEHFQEIKQMLHGKKD